MNKLSTIQLKGNDYATVPTRIKQFRADNPRSSIETTPTLDNGTAVFQATIIKDLKDPNSARATGHSYGKLVGEKSFEKLETIATGRALALLGYLNNGQVATTEEMEEFETYREEQIEKALDKIKKLTKREDFEKLLEELTPEQQKRLAPAINERIRQL